MAPLGNGDRGDQIAKAWEVVHAIEAQAGLEFSTDEKMALFRAADGLPVGTTVQEAVSAPAVTRNIPAGAFDLSTGPQEPSNRDGDGLSSDLDDPDFNSAPRRVKDRIVDLITNPEYGRGGYLVDISGNEFIIETADGERQTFSFNADGSTILPTKALGGTGASASDLSRMNLVNMQTEQLAALMRGDTIDIGDGRMLIPGTGQIVDTRAAGDFKPIEGAPGWYVDSVTGSVVDNNGNVLARDMFEFESGREFQEFHDQHADLLEERIRQFNTSTAETQREFDTNVEVQQKQFNAELDELARTSDNNLREEGRQYDATLAEDQRQFDTNTKVDQAQFGDNFKEDQRQFDIDAREGQRQFDAEFGEGQRRTNLGVFQDISLAGDQNRVAALQGALSGATNLAGIEDNRKMALIDAQANPGRFVEAEYLRRALEGGEPTGPGSGFSDTGQLQQAIQSLLDFEATKVPQVIIDSINAGVPPAEAYFRAGLEPTEVTIAAAQKAADQQIQAYGGNAGIVTPPAGSIGDSDFERRTLEQAQTPAVAPTNTNPTNEPVPTGALSQAGQYYADFLGSKTGGRDVNIDPGISDADILRFANAKPNPDLQGNITTTQPTPEQQATGFVPSGGYYTQDQVNRYANQDAYLAKGGFTNRGVFMTGDPLPDGRPNPEIIENPTGAPIRVRNPKFGAFGMMPKFAFGTIPGSQSTSDYAINNTPSLRDLRGDPGSQGLLSKLGTGNVTGAFGTQLPLAGSINARDALELERSPQAYGVLQSLYNSASLDLTGEINRAKARGPRGRAASIVRT